jgi:hypothetical protein
MKMQYATQNPMIVNNKNRGDLVAVHKSQRVFDQSLGLQRAHVGVHDAFGGLGQQIRR